MRWRALVLVVGVFVAHDSANWIAAGTGLYPWAVFFMLQGAWTSVLALLLVPFVLISDSPTWRPVELTAIGIAVFEGAAIPFCGLAVADFAAIPRGVNVCDHVTGWPVTSITVTFEIVLLVYVTLRSYLRRWDAT